LGKSLSIVAIDFPPSDATVFMDADLYGFDFSYRKNIAGCNLRSYNLCLQQRNFKAARM